MAHIPLSGTVVRDITRNKIVNVESLNVFNEFTTGRTTTLPSGVTFDVTKDFDWEDRLFIFPTDETVAFSGSVTNGINTKISGTDVLFSGTPGRVDFNTINIISENGGKCFDISAGVNVVPFLGLATARIQGFDAIGDLNGMSAGFENVAYIFNGAGWNMNDMGIIGMVEINFVFQTGDHITATGTSSNIFFRDILGNPSTGDQLFNFDGLTVTGNSSFINTIFTNVNGGTSGLIQAISSDTTLGNIFTDIRVDTASNVVEIELPDTSTRLPAIGYKIFITDTGNAQTNNITVIPNASDGTTIQGVLKYGITQDNQITIFELVDSQWVITTDVTAQLRRDFVTANNQITTSSSTFTDALQKDFVIVEDATYLLGYVYQWQHEKKDKRHQVIVRIGGVENTDLRAYHYMGGADDDTDIRMVAANWTLVDLTVGTYDIDLQFASESESAFMFYRRLYLEKWTQ